MGIQIQTIEAYFYKFPRSFLYKGYALIYWNKFGKTCKYAPIVKFEYLNRSNLKYRNIEFEILKSFANILKFSKILQNSFKNIEIQT